MNEEQWINQIRQKLADYEEPAPEMLWEDIEKAMAAQKPKAKTVPMWFRKVAVAAVLLVIAVVGYMTLEHDAPDAGRLTEVVKPHQAPTAPQAENPVQETPAENTLMAQASRLIRRFSPSEPATAAVEETEATPATQEETETTSTPLPSEPEEEVQDNRSEQQHTNNYHSQSTVRPSNPYRSTAAENRLTAKLYFSNTMGSSDRLAMSSHELINGNTFNPDTNNPKPDPGIGETDLPDNGSVNPDENGLPDEENGGSNTGIKPEDDAYTQTITTTHKTRHHQPIRYGLSLRYRLNERWGIETGLTYSLLTADITTTEEGRTTESEQRLNYIGIPLKAEYTIWGSRHFNVYASAGAMVEKMVKGSLETSGKGTKESLSIRPLQFSISSGIGAEYKYNDLFSIYVEPGIGYYFDNGSSVPTFYQDKPLNFNLNVGLRFQLNGK